MAQIVETVETLVQPILDDMGLELVDLEYQREQHGWTLRFFLDKDGGISLDDCAEASREISAILDVEDVIANAYNLEVSSPGLERPLRKIADFEKFVSSLVKIKTWEAFDPDSSGNKRKVFIGRIAGVEGQDVLLNLDDKKSSDIKISLAQISKANLQFEF